MRLGTYRIGQSSATVAASGIAVSTAGQVRMVITDAGK
jgi:hypothetical protein